MSSQSNAPGGNKGLRKPPKKPYLDNENVDFLARINMELLSELWIVRDRMAVVEELLARKGMLSQGEVDDFAPDDEFRRRNEELRSTVVAKVLGAPFEHEQTVDSLVAEGKKLASLHRTPDR